MRVSSYSLELLEILPGNFCSGKSSWRFRIRRVFPTLRFRKFFLAVRRSFSVLSSSAGLPDASLPKGPLGALVFGGSSRRFASEGSSWRLEGPSFSFRKFFFSFCCFVVVTLPFSFVWSVSWPDLDFFYQDLSMSYSSFGKPRSLGAI